MVVNLAVLPLTFISNIWFPTDTMPKVLKDIAGVFPIKALAGGLQYVFDPRHGGAGLQRRRPAGAGDLDGDRHLPDAALPAPARRARWRDAHRPGPVGHAADADRRCRDAGAPSMRLRSEPPRWLAGRPAPGPALAGSPR